MAAVGSGWKGGMVGERGVDSLRKRNCGVSIFERMGSKGMQFTGTLFAMFLVRKLLQYLNPVRL